MKVGYCGVHGQLLESVHQFDLKWWIGHHVSGLEYLSVRKREWRFIQGDTFFRRMKACSLVFLATVALAKKMPPHIVFILADDLVRCVVLAAFEGNYALMALTMTDSFSLLLY